MNALAAVPDLSVPDLAVPDLAALRELVRPTSLGTERFVEVAAPLAELFPAGGPAVGSVMSIDGAAATSLLFSLLAHPSTSGRWTALVGFESLGWAAAVEAGVELSNVIVVQRPPTARWATVVAALVDGFDLVVVAPSVEVRAADARRLAARVRERHSVLVVCGPVGAPGTGAAGGVASTWPDRPDVTLSVTERRWEGLDRGHGRLRRLQLVVRATGRRGSARPRVAELALPFGVTSSHPTVPTLGVNGHIRPEFPQSSTLGAVQRAIPGAERHSA